VLGRSERGYSLGRVPERSDASRLKLTRVQGHERQLQAPGAADWRDIQNARYGSHVRPQQSGRADVSCGCTDPFFSLGWRLTATQVSDDDRSGVMTGGA
jgi:hypothetical protein